MTRTTQDEVRTTVRERYAGVATGRQDGCAVGCCGAGGGCGPTGGGSLDLGYSAGDLAALPEGADLGLGCGNPQAIAALRPGETVLDLGSGGGIDCFLAARQVGPQGRVIGVDMTPEMVTKARANAERVELSNVDFRLGEIEHLPVADASVDVILSNCVINLSPDKASVFREAFRVLRAGGRLAISDVVATATMPDELAQQVSAFTGCITGAAAQSELEALLTEAGFVDVRIVIAPQSRAFIRDWMPGSGAENYIASGVIEARRPGKTACCGPSCCQPEAGASA